MVDVNAMGDPRDVFIRKYSPGKSFIDIGGLSTVVKEKISIAADANAKSLTMMDVETPECVWWGELDKRLKERGIDKCTFISGDIFEEDLDPYDIVHSSGVLYHLPDPLGYISRLRNITKEYCILTSTTIAREISTSSGAIQFPDASVVFVPALHDLEKKIIVEWYAQTGRGDISESVDRFGGWTNFRNYYPNWFIPTVPAFRRMAECGGFEIVDEGPVEPNDYSYCLLLRPTS